MNKVLDDFQIAPDMGSLKRETGEYYSLQNIRGWGNLGTKRQGVTFSTSQTSGIMGIFDFKTDGDPNSLDRIGVVNGNGDLILYQFSELVTFFDYLFAFGVGFNLQAPNSTWWSVLAEDDGAFLVTDITSPSTTRSTDLVIFQNQFIGFQMASNIFRFRIQASTGGLFVESYANAIGTTNFGTSVSFLTGVGPVFQDDDLNMWRLSVNNLGILSTTVI